MDLSRRHFIQSTSSIAASMGLLGIATPALARSGDGPLLTLYDPRFGQARQMAAAASPGSSLLTVDSDITDLAEVLLTNAAQSGPVVIAGVTTETVPFCLQQLASAAGAACLESARLDRDLFLWKLTVKCP
jgi:hypothetical protein